MAALQTPKGTLSFPHLFKPKERALNSNKVYSAVLMLSPADVKTPAFKNLHDKIEDLARQTWPKLTLGRQLKSPLRRADEKPEWVPEEYELFLSAWSNEKPGVVDAKREDIVDSNEVWSGQHARFVVAPFTYDNSGNKGVSLYLHHVQIIRSEGLTRLDGRKPPKDAFDGEFDDEADNDEI
jgi:hypothetical protein